MFYSDFSTFIVKFKTTYTQMDIQPYGFSSRNNLIQLCLKIIFCPFLIIFPDSVQVAIPMLQQLQRTTETKPEH